MRKIQLVMACVMLSLVAGQAQKLSTRSGYVRFFSETKVENIEAINEQMSSIIKVASGEFAFLVPIKGFVFEKALMQEHFNEDGKVSLNSKFTVKPSDYDIEIPAGKRDNISETIEVTVKASYDS